MGRIGADVWVLTETHREFSPGPGYLLVASSADAPDRDAKRGECWVAIWSKLPAVPIHLTADLERVAAAKVSDSVTVVGTVLPWLSDDRHPEIRGEAAFRARLSEQLADWMKLSNSRLCVAGDFNQDLLTTGHYYGSSGGRQALRDALKEAGLQCLTGDGSDPLAAAPGLASIDHICVSGVRSVGLPPSTSWPVVGELDRKLSDHYGVWADLA
jgi:hypothetical protein